MDHEDIDKANDILDTQCLANPKIWPRYNYYNIWETSVAYVALPPLLVLSLNQMINLADCNMNAVDMLAILTMASRLSICMSFAYPMIGRQRPNI